MTMLMQTRDPLERAPSSTQRRDTIKEGAAQARLAMIKRFCISALVAVAAGGAVAAIVALKAAIHLSRFDY
jgi:hypothetical protein